jgi:hypothetical protein
MDQIRNTVENIFNWSNGKPSATFMISFQL